MSIKSTVARPVRIGRLTVGGGAPVRVQGMTKTRTADLKATRLELEALAAAGAELVRLAVKDEEDLAAFARLKSISRLPLVADIHFRGDLALGALAAGADKVRLNPGNLDDPVRLAEIIRLARRKGAAIRIGVNSGSLPGGPGEPVSGLETARLMVRTAAAYLENFETLDFHNLVVSLKSSSVPVTLAANRLFRRHFDYPLHLGVTEAGRGGPALVKSSIGIGALLADGIGETLRVSLSGPAVEEVAAGRWILQALELRNFQPELISCPTCGRCRSDLFSILDRVEDGLKRLPGYPERYAGFKVAVMGCEVNGPGEAAAADIGVACGGKRGLLFRKGRVVERPPAAGLAEALLAELSRLNPGPVKRESNGDHPIKTKPKRGGTSNRRRK
ncbi:MAG TPA: flavodoxin-dependent (E)-4-hydroxy-3-methylbut-2-enyl-diphosphate synthase [bacterium]|uniref:4-hydroxy-3-methylbut-2-en-1-yl diphosphate synthase (flavodoxin) n=1 Tax=candidate division TA06 bacterium ADurb.Bin417 TaxID=1852828 RepID=A0A1V5MEU0_UNCT6|nr:MAG: 4-hydroxy-3-methylbut-2-en-1-yl diphosphate synthase [candidate division TA06 bacterium ADurb.Bin417]HNQ35180.1 flavodoxin-dependent (E)-4-hydroxy-3-methylbut-2-enyl-diphosphate synthase [bacterium]HNS47952.1 flavodoxin-dependent (E)-4-hydroxy-3-methylbut-2-enyl-diphosphate synthase [bacterium]